MTEVVFRPYGRLIELKMMAGFSFVEFEKPQDAAKAVNRLDGIRSFSFPSLTSKIIGQVSAMGLAKPTVSRFVGATKKIL